MWDVYWQQGAYLFNPFPNTPYLDCPKLNEAEDDYLNLAIKGFQDTDCIENIVEKGEIAHLEQFHLFWQCFPNDFLYHLFPKDFFFPVLTLYSTDTHFD